jgi:hypothetical protein
MDLGDDTDPVLRSLSADLERDDPRLAALLSGEGPLRPRRHHRAWLLVLPLLGALFLLPVTTAVGVVVVVLAVASPLVGCLIATGPGGGAVPRHG